jgi:hypothetical protein
VRGSLVESLRVLAERFISAGAHLRDDLGHEALGLTLRIDAPITDPAPLLREGL